jgi:T-complex protein 1 subunit theta
MFRGGIQELLKDGYKHFSGVEEAILKNIDAVRQLAQMTRTSLGPNGMNKMVINHLDKLFVTNDAATIIKELDVIHPAAKMVVQAAQMQEQEIGDATNFVVVFTGELLNQAEALIRTGLHPSEIIAGYEKAGKKALEYLETLSARKLEDLKNVKEVTNFLKPPLSKKFGFEDSLAPLVAQACVQILPKNPKFFNVDNVRVAKILGGGVDDSVVIKGFVLTRDAEGTIKHVTNAKVAVFASGIDSAKTETKGTVVLHNAEELLNYNKSEEKYMEEIVRQIADSGAKVVVSGGPISEMAMHFIEKFKMMAVKVQSKFDLRRLCKATGATAIVRLGAPTPEEMGSCDVVTVEEVGSTKITVFRQENESSAISTIVVRGATPNLLDDIERAIDDAVNVFKGTIKDNRYCAGAGATEIELAKLLKTYADQNPGLDQYAIKKYAEALEIIPRTLAENAGQVATDVVSNLYAAHSKGNTHDGIDVFEGGIKNAVEMGVVDLLAGKYSAIHLSTESAVTILRVDQIIMAKPAGGPKPPKQGPVDGDD